MMTLIRPATPSDIEAVAGLARGLREHQGDDPERFSAEIIARDGFGPTPRFSILVAEAGPTVIGYALYCEGYDTAFGRPNLYLVDLYVDPAARRRGIGRSLIAAVAAAALDRGCQSVWWACLRWNSEAHAFYRTLANVEEPVMAFAVAGPVLDRLARGEEGGAVGVTPAGQPAAASVSGNT